MGTAARTVEDASCKWLDIASFARLAGLKERGSQQALSRAFDGKSWRGHTLTVRAVQGQGHAGKTYKVLASTLPPDLYTNWLKERPEESLPLAPTGGAIVTLQPQVTLDPLQQQRIAQAQWRQRIIAPIVGLKPRSPQRSQAIAAVLAAQHINLRGKAVQISKTQLYAWLKAYDKQPDLHTLAPKKRSDRGQRRTLITQHWDKTCTLDKDQQQAIAEKLAHYTRSLWASGAAGCP